MEDWQIKTNASECSYLDATGFTTGVCFNKDNKNTNKHGIYGICNKEYCPLVVK